MKLSKNNTRAHECVSYEVRLPCKLKRPLRLALLGDLHDHPGDAAVEAVRVMRPDLILVVGDILERSDVPRVPQRYDAYDYGINASPALLRFNRVLDQADVLFSGKKQRSTRHFDNRNGFAFLDALLSIAPVFYSLGNHEKDLSDPVYQRLNTCGVALLDNRSVKLDTPLGAIEIGGLSTRYDLSFLDAFAPSGTASADPARCSRPLRLLLCHHPEYYPWLLRDRDIDLVLSGHAHGGQWRFFGQGVFSPGQGLFPKLTSGMYFENRLVVTPGLSNTASFPRFGNPTQVVIIHIFPEN